MNARLPDPSPVPARLALLRGAMTREDLAAYVVPSADPHLSEYLPERWQARQWLSGFTGSVGTLVVTADFAGLWVDSRYWVQAEAQLAGTGVALMKMAGGQQTQPHVEWLAEHVPEGTTVGVDGAVLGVAAARALTSALTPRGIVLRTDLDLLDAIWPQRPSLPGDAVFEHAAPQADTARAGKLAQVRRAMHEQGAQWHFVSTLDDLAWLFNLRGADVNYNPVFVAHALVGLERATLFVADGKVSPELATSLAQDGVDVKPYDAAAAALAALPEGAGLLIDPRRVTYGLLQAVPQQVRVIEAVNPSTFAKSRKTPAEIEHVRATMELDGAALAEFFAWFEGALGRETITELTIDEQLTAARARRPGYVHVDVFDSAVRVRKADAEQPDSRRLLVQLARKLARLVPVVHVRRDLSRDEPAQRVLQFDVFGPVVRRVRGRAMHRCLLSVRRAGRPGPPSRMLLTGTASFAPILESPNK